MAFTINLRSPTGKLFKINSTNAFVDIPCISAKEMVGQWIFYCSDSDTKLLSVFNGQRIESIGGAYVFNCQLDEASEAFLVIMYGSYVSVVRLFLSTAKLSLEDHHAYIEHRNKLLGYAKIGAHSVAGDDGVVGRTADTKEIAHKIIGRAARSIILSLYVREELSKHDKESGGSSGIDALATLTAYKHHPDWYRVAKAGEKGLRVGNKACIIPLRTAPKTGKEYNAYIGAMTVLITKTIALIPNTPGGLIISSLLQSTKNQIRKYEQGATMSLAVASAYLASSKLPAHSKGLYHLIKQVEKDFREPSFHMPSPGSHSPYFIAPAESIFQEVGVIEILLSYGLREDILTRDYALLASKAGLPFGNYIAWADTAQHGLAGWRDSTMLPSGYKPDLIIVNVTDSSKLLVDAKLRSASAQATLLSASGIKDMQAYMQEYELSKSVMLVPDPNKEGPIADDIQSPKYWIRAISLPATGYTMNRSIVKLLCDEMWNA